jgi:hypothetical protein
MNARRTIKQIVVASVFAAGIAVAACGDDSGGSPDASSNVFDAAGFTCDPVGSNPAMGALLNATLEGDVEVIVKTPQHPGDPGPTNLP